MSVISILVAVYNASNYLRDCLDSLKRQTMQDFCVICVDDESTDDSREILLAYAKEDKRFKVMCSEQNQGQAKARNMALAHVDSPYVCFLDSDDMLSADALKKVCAAFDDTPDVDCVLFTLRYLKDGKTWPYARPIPQEMTGKEAFVKSLDWQIHGVYAVRTAIHLCHPYDESTRVYSDDNTTRLHYLSSKKVVPCEGIYYYRQHADSVTHRMDKHRFDILRANESMALTLSQLQLDASIICHYESLRWLQVIDAYYFYYKSRQKLSKVDRRYGLQEIRRVRNSLDFNKIKAAYKCKWGYRPILFSWVLFRLQEESYFAMRKLLGRL